MFAESTSIAPDWFGDLTKLAMYVFALVPIMMIGSALMTSRARGKTSGQVIGIVGLMGGGKTYNAVRLGYERMRKGVPVVSNVVFDEAALGEVGALWSPFRGWDDLINVRDSVIIIDEAHIYARGGTRPLPLVAQISLSQARHHRNDIYWISQNEGRVHKQLRELTNVLILTESWFGGRLFVQRGWEPEKFRKAKKQLFRRFVWFSMKIGKLYDTHEMVRPDEYALAGDDAKSVAALRRAGFLQDDGADGDTGSVVSSRTKQNGSSSQRVRVVRAGDR